MLEPQDASEVRYRGVRILTSAVYPGDWDDCQSCGFGVDSWSDAWFIVEGEGELYGPFCSSACAKNKIDSFEER